jgi:hypothetical protein
MWVAIQQHGAERFGKDRGMRRAFKRDGMVPIKKILPHILGRIITIAALSGIEDRKASILHVCQLLEKHSNDASFSEKYREKCIKIGYRGKPGGSDDEES